MIMAFFPCIYFCGVSQITFNLSYRNYSTWDYKKIFDYILHQNQQRAYFFELLNKLVGVCLIRGLRIVVENPYSMQTYLRTFLKEPDVLDNNRMERGDYFVKPTAYWFFNCKPTFGYSFQNDKQKKSILKSKKSGQGGICSEERSMISPDYARNFICDFLLGKEQPHTQPSLFKEFDLSDLKNENSENNNLELKEIKHGKKI